MTTGEVIALIKAFGGGGGGSSGGGVLVVHMSAGTLDKTWAEIADAVSEKPVLIIFVNDVNRTTTVLYVTGVQRASKAGEKYYVTAFSPVAGGIEYSIVTFAANTSGDYPVIQE